VRVLVTGGSGFVGRAVAAELAQHGHDVTVGSRSGESVADVRGVSLDVTSAASVQAAVESVRPDAVVHLVGIIAEAGAQTFQRVHVDGTRHVLAALPDGTRVLHMSALGARHDAASAYARSKARAEALVQERGLPWTVFRPSLIFGPGDDFFGRVLRGLVLTGPVVPVIGDGSFPFRPVSVQDVAQAFARALQDENGTVGRVFELTGPVEYRFDELLRLELQALGKRKPFVRVPLWLMRAVVPLMQVLPRPPITRDQFAMLVEGNTADPAPARDALGLRMRRLDEDLPALLRSPGTV